MEADALAEYVSIDLGVRKRILRPHIPDPAIGYTAEIVVQNQRVGAVLLIPHCVAAADQCVTAQIQCLAACNGRRRLGEGGSLGEAGRQAVTVPFILHCAFTAED